MTFRVEGLYVNLEHGNRNIGVFAVTPNATVVFAPLVRPPPDTEFAVVRAGLNYKFGSY